MNLKNRRNAANVLSIVYFLCAAFLFSQESEDWFYGKPIASIKFEGLTTVKKSDLTGITKSYVGKKFSDELYFELLGRIGALEYFESYEPTVFPGDSDKQSVSITFTVTENPAISKITFVGNRGLRTTELKAKIAIKEKEIFSETRLATEERNIREMYLEKGFTNIRITTNYVLGFEGVEISFLINEGTATTLRSIKFEGNQIISSRTLKGTMKLKEKSLFNKGAFQESTLEIDKQSILNYYRNRGYIDATLTDIIREEAADADGNGVLDLIFVLSEGYQYTYNGTTFDGNWLFSSEFLGSKIKLETGDVFNFTKFQDGLSAVSDVYYENGYITTAIVPEQFKDAERREISFKISIEERSRSHVENIIVQGNKKTKDYVITRELPFFPGDIFSRTKLMSGFRNLYNSQYFSSVVPDVIPGSEEDLVNVVVNVEEQSTTSIEFGLSFAGLSDPNSFPVSVFGKWQDSNVFGTGRTIALEGNFSPDNQSLSAAYTDNWLFGQPISFNTQVSGSRSSVSTLQRVYTASGWDTTNYPMKYTQYNITLNNSLGKRWYPASMMISLTGGLSNQFLRNVYDAAFVPVDSAVSDYQYNFGILNSVWGAVAADARDISHDPSSGWFAKEHLTWSGLIPQFENQFYLKSETTGEIYFTLLDHPFTDKWNLKLVFAAISKFTFLEPLKNHSISSTNQLSIDGMFSARGWDSIYTTKGKALWSNNFELRVPIMPNVVAADFFFDAAMLKSDTKQMFKNMTLNDFYFSFGPGVRSLMAQFPLRVMLANTFKMTNGNFSWGNGKNPDWKFVLSFNITNN